MGADVNDIIQRNGRRQVWQLTATAIGGGIATFLAIWIAQVYIASEHDYLDEIRTSLSDVIHTLETSAGRECQTLTSQLLGGESFGGKTIEELDSDTDRELAKLHEVIESGEVHLSGKLKTQINSTFSAEVDIDVVRKKVSDWDADYSATKLALAAKHREVSGDLTELRLHFIDLEGRAKLAIITKQRQLKDADPEGQRTLVEEFETFFRMENGAVQAKADVVDLLVAVERLAYGADHDQLTDLKSNVFEPTLSRLHEILTDERSRALLEKAEVSLFGQAKGAEAGAATKVVDGAGLYEVRRRMCELEREQRRLIQSVETAFANFRTNVDQMDREMLVMSENWSESSRIWIFTAIVGLLCAATFVFLARSIVKKISGQFTTILEAHRDLNHAQRLESIGELAAGIAHEINTPMQFVQDNTQYLRRLFRQATG